VGHTYTRLILHIIFSTKDRIPYLAHDRREEIFAYVGGILRELKCEPLHINAMPDHVHALLRVPPTIAIAEVVQKMKGSSAKWIHDKRSLPRAFAWQRGYSAFSVSESNVERVSRGLSCLRHLYFLRVLHHRLKPVAKRIWPLTRL
jgi:REP element-mobilizing transposase RayT